MSFLKQHGLNGLLKDGSTSTEKPVFKNIAALLQLKSTISACYGPNGLTKLILNAHGKRIVSKDCSIILSEVEIDHPAVSLVKEASLQQLVEIGDGSAAVVLLAGELASRAERMLREMGIPLGDVVTGYRKALALAEDMLKLEILKLDTTKGDSGETSEVAHSRNGGLLVNRIYDVLNPLNRPLILSLLRSAMDSKLISVTDRSNILHLSNIALGACLNAIQTTHSVSEIQGISFNPDHVRVIRMPGGHVMDSTFISGFVLKHAVETGTKKLVRDAKLVIYDCAFDIMASETKGNVLFETDEQMIEYSKKEEQRIEELVIQLHQKLGINVVISSSSFGEIPLHFLRKHGMMAIKVSQKHELRRLCVAVGAKPYSRVNQLPNAEDVGTCDLVEELEEISVQEHHASRSRTVPLETPIVVFRSQVGERTKSNNIISSDCKISSIVIRGYTQPMQEYMQQAFNNAVNIFRLLLHQPGRDVSNNSFCEHSKLGGFVVAGGGAFEAELSCRISDSISRDTTTYQESPEALNSLSDIEKCVVQEFAESLFVLPTALADNSGDKSMETFTKLKAAHSISSLSQDAGCFVGVDIQNGGICQMLSGFSGAESSSLSSSKDILEPLSVKLSALHLATSTVLDILSIDQMIMSKRAGGPKKLQGANSALDE